MQHQKVRSRRNHHRKVSSLILIGCIVLAVMTVLLVPMLVGGAPAQAAPEAAPVPTEAETLAVADLAEASQELGFDATLPATLPAEYQLAAINVVNGDVLEMEYTNVNGKAPIIYRTAPGSDDLTWDETEYAFTVTEEEGGVTRSYAGVAEQKLSVALWAGDGYSYAVVAPDGIDAEALHIVAESVG